LTEPISFLGEEVPFGANLLFSCAEVPDLVVAAEICEDLWVPMPPSIQHAMAGATVLVNGSASDETTGKEAYRRELVKSQSARLVCGYIYASAGEGESSTDLVFSAHNLICENGTVLQEAKRFTTGVSYSELDLGRIKSERRRLITHETESRKAYTLVDFHLKERGRVSLTRSFSPRPFVPENPGERTRRCEEILTIQAMGLKKRLEHTKAASAVIGISGGLDSTLALLVTVRAFDLLGWDRKGILAVTMPCFGTTDRTYRNAVSLNEQLHTTLKEIPISEAVRIHFRDIGQEEGNHDVVYENSQARERTQILMDLANMTGGLVIGTGDLSELALGWATYNGDHISMYGVNVSVPKTLVRHLVRYYADTCGDARTKAVLEDVLATPVSPELLPPEDGKISQKTEDLVGPYELHDFFLYYMMRFGYSPQKLFRIACCTFEGLYAPEIILKWMKVFYRRFFAQQFKRSCLPDGPRVGSVSLSPRGDLRMPSDACTTLWMEELERITL
jgi:NAD+ synthase (glutamine-hydrolysing)